MQYHGATYLKDAWDIYWFEKNLQGDISTVYNAEGLAYVTYRYDAWGYAYYESLECAEVWGFTALNNPFRYRGYYYDQDLMLYYINSRYYDWEIGRFISPDSVSSLGANGDLTSYNLYAYCSNNPIGLAYRSCGVGANSGGRDIIASSISVGLVNYSIETSSSNAISNVRCDTNCS